MSFLSRPVVSGWVLLLVGVAPAGAATAAEVAAKPDPAAISFFEKKIRPLLSQQCYKCHSTTSEKLKGGLYLDSRDGMLKGGDTGPSLEPGHPEHSLLISAVKWSTSGRSFCSMVLPRSIHMRKPLYQVAGSMQRRASVPITRKWL